MRMEILASYNCSWFLLVITLVASIKLFCLSTMCRVVARVNVYNWIEAERKRFCVMNFAYYNYTPLSCTTKYFLLSRIAINFLSVKAIMQNLELMLCSLYFNIRSHFSLKHRLCTN